MIRYMNIIKPLLAGAIFFFLAIYFTFYFNPTHALGTFLSSPFNMSTELSNNGIYYNLYLPTILIVMIGLYLKNFNKAFARKCSLRAIFLISILASYIKSIGSMIYYRGYADYGISLGTSIITLCFLAAFIISLEVYIGQKEHTMHLYGHFLFSILTVLVIVLAALMFLSFFTTSSFLVHLMGLLAFIIVFVPFYERHNIRLFFKEEEDKIAKVLKEAHQNASINK